MKKNLMFVYFAGALLLAGCGKDEVGIIPNPEEPKTEEPTTEEPKTEEPKTEEVTFRATYSDEPSSRTFYDGNSFKWEGGEQISVNGKTSETGSTLTDDVLPFTVKGLEKEATYDALYPASLVADASQYNAETGTYAITLPSVQAWIGEKSYTTEQCPAVASGNNTDLTFTSLCGYLKFVVLGVPSEIPNVGTLRMDVGAGKYISGEATVSPKDKTLTVDTNTGNTWVDVTFDGGRLFSNVPTFVTIVLPAGSYESGCTIRLYDKDIPTRILAETTISDGFNIQRGEASYLGNEFGNIPMQPIPPTSTHLGDISAGN